MNSDDQDITQALLDAYNGDKTAAEHLWTLVYDALQEMAHRELIGERRGQTLNTRGLVHEAYAKLVNQNRCTWRNRDHFYAVACTVMRRIIVDRARRRSAARRKGQHVPLEEADRERVASRSEDLIALDEALTRLAKKDERLSKVVECRFFGGLTVRETAQVLGVGTRTIERDWKRAKAHLHKELRSNPDT